MRHMYTNFRQSFKGKELKDMLWNAARASYVAQLEICLQRIEDRSLEARQWLRGRPSAHWSRACFSEKAQCDMLLNNLCECFNKYILDARDKGIITMFEMVRTKLMKRLKAKADLVKKWKFNWCPKILNTLEKNKQQAWLYHAIFSGGPRAQVCGGGEQYVVDLESRTCSCRRWQLTGIPCAHAIQAIVEQNEDPQTYLASCYKVETYMKVYSHYIEPINGHELWPNVEEKVKIVPPEPVRKKKGRKRLMRRKESEELEKASAKKKLKKRQGLVMRCSKCGGLNHNKRTCKKVPALNFCSILT